MVTLPTNVTSTTPQGSPTSPTHSAMHNEIHRRLNMLALDYTNDFLGLGTDTPVRSFEALSDFTPTPVEDSAAGITWSFSKRGMDTAEALASVEPATVQVGLAVGDDVPADDVENDLTAAFAAVINTRKTGSYSAVAIRGQAASLAAAAHVWGATFTAYSSSGAAGLGTRLTGLEVNVHPAAGTAPSAATGGVVIGAFGVDNMGSDGGAVFIFGSSPGTWNKGINIHGSSISSVGSGIFYDGVNAAYGINISDGNFTTATAYLTNEADAPVLILKQLDSTSPTAAIFQVLHNTGVVALNVAATNSVRITSPTSAASFLTLDTTTASQNSNLQFAEATTVIWAIQNEGATDLLNVRNAVLGTNVASFSNAALGANETALFLREDTATVETSRRVKWFDPGAGGANFVGGEKVLYLA